MYSSCLPNVEDFQMRPMQQLSDLFSLPEAGLLVTIIDYLEKRGYAFDPLALFKDVQVCGV